jgi:hypothetical protein
MKIFCFATLCLLLSACATGGYDPRYYYDDIVIANLTGETVRNLKIEVGPEGRVLECAEVTNFRLCQQRIGRRPYPNAEIQLSWQNSAGEPMSKQMNPQIGAYYGVGLALRLMVDMKADGSVEAYFKQDTMFEL